MDPLSINQTLSPGSTGPAVKRVQEWLTLHGFPVSIDGDFGPLTGSAVSRFRQSKGFGAGTSVDAQVYATLVLPMVQALSPIERRPDFASTVLAVAERQLAQSPLEVGGQNRGPWVRLYMDGNEGAEQRWCAGFVTWCLRQASISLGEPRPLPGSVSCDELAAQAKARGYFVSGASSADRVRPGHVFLLPKPGAPSDWFHTGFVRSVTGSTFETIEGNSSAANQANGDRVMWRQRSLAACDFIAY